MAAASLHKVKIAARLRPRISGEPNDDAVQVHHPSADAADDSASSTAGATVIAVTNPRDPSQVFKFPFTSCYDEAATQEEIFVNDVQPMVDIVYSGVTVTIFAYGVTSSGKTHTMQGTKTDPGVIPRVVRSMFTRAGEGTQLTVSYIEIYKDDVYDLLVARENAPKLPVRESETGAVFVANVTRAPVGSVDEFDAIYAHANKQRSVGATNLNRASSRSHAVLTIEVEVADGGAGKVRTGKINLVDLAGSENNKLTGNDPARMAESAAINRSLSVLGQVVHALNQGAPRIPYRNSKLTRILQDALGGNAVGLLICCLAPGTRFRQDTLNTLNFAVRTKNIENRVVVNERDTRAPTQQPVAKLAPAQPPAPKPAPPANGGAGRAPRRVSLVPRPRASLVPHPRASAFGLGFQPFAVPAARRVEKEKTEGMGMSEKEIDERIAKAVEAEVARRLEEREREREKEKDEEGHRRSGSGSSWHKSKAPRKERDRELPAGCLSPPLKRHKDLDDELKARLQELERKFERGNKEVQLADVLSPVSKKKTGRAYVALARAHSEKGDLQVALDLYRRAEAYVPDNVKLKERIIEIEWAVKNDKAFKPSPKRVKKSKGKKKQTKAEAEPEAVPMEVDDGQEQDPAHDDRGAHPMSDDDQMELDEVENSLTDLAAFGTELTNTGSKRSLAALDGGMETPAKRPKRGGKKPVVVEESDEEFVPDAAPRKSKRKLAAAAA
ncbi:P-loop containing nucleoside triphosphate hydrolase protein [Mycena sp. CBHHK59/15]|nr:P-loop containing nucleoside triphosphate hydrolase protein [Mycena sp. CBHHK59/15]